MKGQMHTDLGQVIIDEEVIATYAGINAIECFGIVGMASVNMKDGFAQLLKRDNVSKMSMASSLRILARYSKLVSIMIYVL